MVQAMDIPAVLGASGEVLLAMVDHRSDLKLMRVAIITPKAIRVDGYEEQETPGGNAVPGWNSSENTNHKWQAGQANGNGIILPCWTIPSRRSRPSGHFLSTVTSNFSWATAQAGS